MERKGKPTIKDVAKAAGVSPTTVSHALNGKGVVNRETVARIEAAAAEIGYHANPIASSLRTSSFKLIALIFRPLNNLETYLPEGVDYFLRLTGAASLAAMEQGYSLMLVDDPSKPGASLSTRAADAYIVSEPFDNDPILTFLTDMHIPFVTVGVDLSRSDEFPSIGGEEDAQAQIALEHLVSAGAQRVGLVVGTDTNSWNQFSKTEYEQWCAARSQQPMTFAAPERDGELAGPSILDHFFGTTAAEQHDAITTGTAPDALFCLTGRHAAGVQAEAARRGIRIPEDLMLIAASGSVQNMTSRPAVSVLDLKPEALARQAVEVAIALAEGRPYDDYIVAEPPSLIARESTQRR